MSRGGIRSYPPSPPPVARWEWIALAILLVVGGFLRLYRPDLAYFNLHVERDLYRALQLLRLDEIPLLGSEMQYGGRVFGPLVYVLYAIPLAVSHSPVVVGYFIGLLNTGLLVLTWWFARRYFGQPAGIAAAATYAVFPLEIVQLRFLWNPCFLPLMVLGMYWCLYRYLILEKKWALVGVTLFFAFALQLHFSIVMTLPAIILALVWRRRMPPARVVLACAALLFVLFLPMLISEIRGGEPNIREVLEAPESRRGMVERHLPNPNAWRNLLHVVTFDWHENPYRLGFTYLYPLREALRDGLGGWFHPLQGLAVLVGLLHFLFWLCGILYIINNAIAYRRNASKWLPDHRRSWRNEVLAGLLLLAWQFAPLLFLTFFNYHNPIRSGASALIPIRYYLITFPAPFLLAGIGISRLFFDDGCPVRRMKMALVPLSLIFAFYAAVSGAHLANVSRTGVGLPYLFYHAPSLERMKEVREVLLDDFRITVDDYYERVYTWNVFQPLAGEATMDYLITQDARGYENPGLAEGRSVLIWGPVTEGPPGLDPPPEEEWQLQLPEAGPREVEHREVGRLRILLLEGPVPDSHPFDPVAKRNFYYREERMRFLARDSAR